MVVYDKVWALHVNQGECHIHFCLPYVQLNSALHGKKGLTANTDEHPEATEANQDDTNIDRLHVSHNTNEL